MDEDRAAKNRQIVELLREAFARLTDKLTADIEPAPVYQPAGKPPEHEE